MRKPGGQSETLPGMPPPFELSRATVNGETVIAFGPRAVFVFDPKDRGMRNLAIVALTNAGASGIEVAALFGLRPEYVSRLRGRADEHGSAGLVTEMGRPRSLDEKGVSRAYALSDAGRSNVEIADEVGVSASTISRLLARRPRPEMARLDLDMSGEPAGAQDTSGENEDGGAVDDEGDAGGECAEGESDEEPVEDVPEQAPGTGSSRIGTGVVPSRYAGAMLLHGFLDRAGANAVLAAIPGPLARRYDAASVLASATFGFALGSSSAEGMKHLLTKDAGAAVGISRFPHLRTLRPRLSALAERIDPLAIQGSLARAMLAADERPPELFFVDDHFVAYTGSAPVQKGWNTRRRHAEAGRDDTVIVDDTWRAICFSSGPPSGLSKTMFDPLTQLRSILGEHRIMIGFDRGGSYPKVFAELKERGFDFVTYRRAPLKTPAVAPSRSWTVVEGRRKYMSVADESVVLDGVGTVRQISIFEHEKVALQILTSDTSASAAFLARRLVGRWCIENAFKYLEDHHGIHWLCDYTMAISPDTTAVANPARAAARAEHKATETAVATLERAIGTTATIPGTDISDTNRTLSRLQDELATARIERDEARARLRPIPAKVPRNELDPTAERATPRLAHRALQMVCRLLAYNAELDLARSLNAYLEDDDEYRAITRNLLHQPGTIAYERRTITVTLRSPDSPRVARALGLLCDQLNADPPHLSGDRRPITYEIADRD